MYAKITGTGGYLPQDILTNEMLTKMVETSDSWIKERTGIETRRIAKNTTTWEMGLAAAEKALADAGKTPKDIDLVIATTVTPDSFSPSLSCLVAGKLGIVGVPAFDVGAACSGFVYALDAADSYIKCQKVKCVLIVSAERLSAITDYSDRSTCILFGDAAAAAVVEASDTPGILGTYLTSDGQKGDMLTVAALYAENPLGARRREPGYLQMNGREVFRFAVGAVMEAVDKVLEKTSLKIEDVDWVVLHQANARIIRSVVERTGLPPERVPGNVDRLGNTSSASIPVLLDEMRKEGKIRPGDRVILTGFGGGMTCAAAILQM